MSSTLDEMTVEAYSDLSGPVLGHLLCELTQEIRVLEARRLAVLAAFDRSGQWAIEGATSAGAWVAQETHCDTAQGHRDAHLARHLRDMPATEAALAEGAISLDHARAIVAARHVDGFGSSEAALVRHARALRPHETRKVVTHWRMTQGDETVPQDRERRALYLAKLFNGQWDLRGTLEGEDGSIVSRALQHHVDRTPDGPGDPKRTRRQRRADALVEILDRYLRGALGTATQRPHINVTCSLETLTGASNESGSTSDGEPLSAAACRRLAQDATITRVITDPEGLPLDVGRAHRTVTHAIRTALTVRDRGCSVPGCDMPPDWCDACHIGPGWAGGVPTSLGTTALGCRRHHMMEQRGQLHLAMRRGRPVWSGADGTEIQARPRGTGRAPPRAA